MSDTLSEQEQEELVQELEHRRDLRGVIAVVASAIAITFSAFQIWLAARGFVFQLTLPAIGNVQLAALQLLQVNAIHVTFALLLSFLLFPTTTGRGFLSRRLGQIVPAVQERFGEDNPVTRVAAGVRRGVRWLMVDPERKRVTPVDFVMMGIALLSVWYMLTDFDEIRGMRALGLGFGRTISEVYPFLSPVTDALSAIGIPLNEVSYAFVLGALGVLLVLEATRRVLGLYLMIIVASFIVYARWGYLIPIDAPIIGVLSIPPLDWSSIVQNLWYNTENGVFGIPVTVSVRFIFIFILFGAFLEMSGAGQWFIELAYSATGQRKGGPAKASILASGFMGTISGSSIANTVTTGAFTIPLMKRSGYRPEFAGAVEASASSGGQILPPVMGAAAFLIVEYTLTPFRDVIIAAAIPAIVFFFGVWVMVHLEASKENIGGLADSEIVGFQPHLLRGWFYLVPLILLLHYLIIERLSIERAAWYTLVAIAALIALIAAYNRTSRVPLVGTIVGISALQFASFVTAGVGIVSLLAGGGGAETGLAPIAALNVVAGQLGWIILAVSLVTLLLRPHADAPLLDFDGQVDDAVAKGANVLRRPKLADNRGFQYGGFVLTSMDSGARTATTVVIAVAAAGVIPGVISVSGLGPNLTALIQTVSGGSIVALLVLTAISSIILGMGMPTTVTYIILVSMLGDAIAGFGIPILSAHLFILYFGVIADITPPVAVAAYAASGIAKSDQFQTGVEAFSLSLNKAIVPFAFVLTPGILLLRGVGTGQEVRVIGVNDVTNLGYFVPDVLIPVAGVFVGVVALGATVIGYLYADVSRADRVWFALAALLLMAPLLLFNTVTSLFGLVGLPTVEPGSFDLLLRAVGAVAFGALALKNRRRADREAAEERGTTEAA
ncbi:TRAP transporter, 4TM/12TM fusion protein [Haladaptatus litoreus]|uniref:TRAP transporter, 4TM/12TM fusion protein n=1 Tax=Haladaptatus litoreus TaxID=553468 RepID=A0A1N7BZ38_9EURY|nr:TRAP transporter fused permease subunit [Haladaptatus litoreus]SIR56566.1 TRAP transporter, 4TM/12TM fusion protein [Haladaptatus litoreus]